MSANILKIRDDHKPTRFIADGGNFRIDSDSDSVRKTSWLPDNPTDFALSDLRKGIEPWLTSLFQSEHFSVLIGSGLTTAIQYIADVKPPEGMNAPTFTSKHADQIKISAESSARISGRGNTNIEDYIRIANELLLGLKILGNESEFVEL